MLHTCTFLCSPTILKVCGFVLSKQAFFTSLPQKPTWTLSAEFFLSLSQNKPGWSKAKGKVKVSHPNTSVHLNKFWIEFTHNRERAIEFPYLKCIYSSLEQNSPSFLFTQQYTTHQYIHPRVLYKIDYSMRNSAFGCWDCALLSHCIKMPASKPSSVHHSNFWQHC